ncbi:hypothetical protein PPBDW_I21674 [Photobacterium kishitanii]|nr:hypothetical protein PPBDW_I21674 [Photobacterium kishitanii]
MWFMFILSFTGFAQKGDLGRFFFVSTLEKNRYFHDIFKFPVLSYKIIIYI